MRTRTILLSLLATVVLSPAIALAQSPVGALAGIAKSGDVAVIRNVATGWRSDGSWAWMAPHEGPRPPPLATALPPYVAWLGNAAVMAVATAWAGAALALGLYSAEAAQPDPEP